MFPPVPAVSEPRLSLVTQELEQRISPPLGNPHHCPEVDRPFLVSLLKFMIGLHAKPVNDPPDDWELGPGSTAASFFLYVFGYKQPIDLDDMVRIRDFNRRVLGVTIKPDAKRTKGAITYVAPVCIEVSTTLGEQQSRSDPNGRTEFASRRLPSLDLPPRVQQETPTRSSDRERDRATDDRSRTYDRERDRATDERLRGAMNKRSGSRLMYALSYLLGNEEVQE